MIYDVYRVDICRVDIVLYLAVCLKTHLEIYHTGMDNIQSYYKITSHVIVVQAGQYHWIAPLGQYHHGI